PCRRIAPKSPREQHVQRQAAGETDEPAGAVEPDRPRKHDEEQQHAAESRRRAGLGGERGQRAPRSPHRRFASEHPEEKYARGRAPVFDEVMRQHERRPFVVALQQAREAAYDPGEYVEQESFMRASEIRALAERARIVAGASVLDLCCGVAGPGRLLTREFGCSYLGVDASASAVALARERGGDLPCRLGVAHVPPLPTGTFDVVLLLETMLAFPDKETLVEGVSRALPVGGRFAFTLEEGLPLTTSERARMPDADTVWLTPLDEMQAMLARDVLVVRWQEDWSR